MLARADCSCARSGLPELSSARTGHEPDAVSRLVLEYDGSRFAGWARQPGARTIQEVLERALCTLLRVDSVAVTVAGRTDAGVHAWGQVASYSGPVLPVSGLNALLPDDVAVLSCCEAGAEFDARRDATSRAYCYRVLARPARSALERRTVLHWPHRVDFGLLCECASALVGTHDFTAFTPTATEHVRFERDVYGAFWRARSGSELPVAGAASGFGSELPVAGSSSGFGSELPVAGSASGVGSELPVAGSASGVGSELPVAGSASGVGSELPVAGASSASGSASGDLLEFWIEADAFMRNMNRVLVGTMLEVGGGRRSLDELVSLLDGRPRSDAGPTAPPHGLYLAGVGYNGRRVLTS